MGRLTPDHWVGGLAEKSAQGGAWRQKRGDRNPIEPLRFRVRAMLTDTDLSVNHLGAPPSNEVRADRC